jgi:hypothetical protein
MGDPLSQLLDTVRNVPTDRLADALKSLHVRQSDTPWPRPNQTNGSPATPYDDARRFFVEVERRRKHEYATATAIIERMRAREVTAKKQAARTFPAQQTVQVATIAGASAGARFVVVNPHQRAIRVRFEVGVPLRNSAPARAIQISLLPDVLEMKPATARSYARASIYATPACAVEIRSRSPIEACAGSRALMKVWIEVEVAGMENHDG